MRSGVIPCAVRNEARIPSLARPHSRCPVPIHQCERANISSRARSSARQLSGSRNLAKESNGDSCSCILHLFLPMVSTCAARLRARKYGLRGSHGCGNLRCATPLEVAQGQNGAITFWQEAQKLSHAHLVLTPRPPAHQRSWYEPSHRAQLCTQSSL
jgi:hypothetical protein